VGTLAVVIKELRLKDETRILFVQGLKRFRVSRFLQLSPYSEAEVEYLADRLPPAESEKDTGTVRRRIETLFEKVVSLQPNLSEDLVTIILNIEELSLMADFIASILLLESGWLLNRICWKPSMCCHAWKKSRRNSGSCF
jgi:ATP-dependent Lon protease